MGNDRNEVLELVALDFLAEAEGPVGSTRLAEAFQENGHDLALATAGRFLRRLEVLGYTQSKGAKLGRVITPKGKARLDELKMAASLQEKSVRMMDAATITNLSDLHELLLVRRAMEAEAARLAAQRATDEELAAIDRQARLHAGEVARGRVPGAGASIDFHQSIIAASHNPVLISLALVLLEPKNRLLIDTLENVTVDSAKVASHAADHVEIAAALLSRDPDRSEAVVHRHISNMIAPVAARLSSGGKLDGKLLADTETAPRVE